MSDPVLIVLDPAAVDRIPDLLGDVPPEDVTGAIFAAIDLDRSGVDTHG